MRTRAAIVLTLAAAFAALLPLARAGAGGFCMDTRSQSFSDTDGTKVSMADYCFSPTVIRVGTGDTVTWTNDDKEFHAVGGAAGTFGEAHTEIKPGDSVSYRFDQEGTFPYVCVYHPGMAGAVVVGDGEGPAFKAGGIVSAGSDEAGTGTTTTTKDPATSPATANSTRNSGWLLIGGLVIAALLALLIFGFGRRNDADTTVKA